MTNPAEPPPAEPNPRDLPGCGLAAYVMIILSIASVGAIGMTVSWYSLVAGSQQLSPLRTSYGGVVDPAVLAPMRAAKLLGQEEIPDAFHAERADGQAACAISGTRLLRLSAEAGAQAVNLADITTVTGDDASVTSTAPNATIVCPFGPGEGAASFKAMLERR